eukprot:gnl/TRDRNA2_/TRDRNA2_164740_c2_seq1.p1 gnl/TRDRNA2_/TRDRNA2_164740_c2~~gnl/TRDRNA2_/TRDRNA2_164740_c2_seq1.p1  ORF type:complete len:119 (-),score=13.70 gnl/TRDRNA2_/TRDRNA2_164740_c2_seq1:240-596(-)
MARWFDVQNALDSSDPGSSPSQIDWLTLSEHWKTISSILLTLAQARTAMVAQLPGDQTRPLPEVMANLDKAYRTTMCGSMFNTADLIKLGVSHEAARKQTAVCMRLCMQKGSSLSPTP